MENPSTHLFCCIAAGFASLLLLSACGSTTEPVASDSTESTATSGVVEQSATPPTTAASATTTPPNDEVELTTDEPPVDLIEFTLDSGVTRQIAKLEPGAEPPLPAGAVETMVDFDGQQIRTIEIPGAEPTIVLMHGFPDNLHLYDQVFPLLEGRRVVAFDFVGWGASSKPLPGTYPYDSDQQLLELAAVTDAYSLDQMVLVVHDASGPPGIDFAAANPDRVAELVILNSFYGLAPGLVTPRAIEIHSSPVLEAVERAIDRDAAAAEALFRFQLDEFIVKPENKDRIDDLWAQFGDAFPAFVALNDTLFAGVVSRNTAGTLSNLAMPVRVAFGAEDRYLSAELAEYFASLPADATLSLFDGVGHFPQIDAPAETAAVILGG